MLFLGWGAWGRRRLGLRAAADHGGAEALFRERALGGLNPDGFYIVSDDMGLVPDQLLLLVGGLLAFHVRLVSVGEIQQLHLVHVGELVYPYHLLRAACGLDNLGDGQGKGVAGEGGVPPHFLALHLLFVLAVAVVVPAQALHPCTTMTVSLYFFLFSL